MNGSWCLVYISSVALLMPAVYVSALNSEDWLLMCPPGTSFRAREASEAGDSSSPEYLHSSLLSSLGLNQSVLIIVSLWKSHFVEKDNGV